MESKNIMQKDLTKYNRRTWLNPLSSDSTSAVVAYDGKVTDIDTKKQYEHRFLEISSCKGKITLHQTSDDTKEDFITKIKLLKTELTLFIQHLENESL